MWVLLVHGNLSPVDQRASRKQAKEETGKELWRAPWRLPPYETTKQLYKKKDECVLNNEKNMTDTMFIVKFSS